MDKGKYYEGLVDKWWLISCGGKEDELIKGESDISKLGDWVISVTKIGKPRMNWFEKKLTLTLNLQVLMWWDETNNYT